MAKKAPNKTKTERADRLPRPKGHDKGPLVEGKVELLDADKMAEKDGEYLCQVVSLLQKRQDDGSLRMVRILHAGTAKIVSAEPQNSATRLAPHLTMLRPRVVPGAPMELYSTDSDLSKLPDQYILAKDEYVLPFGHCFGAESDDDVLEKNGKKRGAEYEILKYPDPSDPVWEEADLSPYEYPPTDENADLVVATERLDYVPEVSNETKYVDKAKRSIGLGWYGERLRVTHRLSKSDGFPYYDYHYKNGARTKLFYCPPGQFVMGSNHLSEEEKPAHIINMTCGTYMQRFALRVGEFAAFVKATGYKTTREKEDTSPNAVSWKSPGFPVNDKHPVVLVTLDDVQECAKWMGLKIPTEHQWEYAARGPDARPFPWGYDPPSNDLLIWSGSGISRTGTEECGKVPDGQSPWGGEDMAGNAWEWTCSEYAKYPADAPQPPATYWKIGGLFTFVDPANADRVVFVQRDAQLPPIGLEK